MIRIFLIVLFLLLFVTIGQIAIVISFVISVFNKKQQQIFDYKYVYFILKTILFLSGANLIIKNKNNLSILDDENAMIVSNHRSDFDIVIGHSIIKKPISYISKIEISKVPIISIWAKKINTLFLDRKDLRQNMKIIIEAIKYINDKKNIWIFPEGTRNKNNTKTELLDFKEGSFSIAKKTGCYILPIAFYNTDDIFEKHKPLIKKNTIKINIGKAFKISEVDNIDKDNVGKYVQNLIKELLIELE